MKIYKYAGRGLYYPIDMKDLRATLRYGWSDPALKKDVDDANDLIKSFNLLYTHVVHDDDGWVFVARTLGMKKIGGHWKPSFEIARREHGDYGIDRFDVYRVIIHDIEYKVVVFKFYFGHNTRPTVTCFFKKKIEPADLRKALESCGVDSILTIS